MQPPSLTSAKLGLCLIRLCLIAEHSEFADHIRKCCVHLRDPVAPPASVQHQIIAFSLTSQLRWKWTGGAEEEEEKTGQRNGRRTADDGRSKSESTGAFYLDTPTYVRFTRGVGLIEADSSGIFLGNWVYFDDHFMSRLVFLGCRGTVGTLNMARSWKGESLLKEIFATSALGSWPAAVSNRPQYFATLAPLALGTSFNPSLIINPSFFSPLSVYFKPQTADMPYC